jgi:putrescine transport system permease protein
MKKLSGFLIAMLCFGYAFFYVPILSMMFFSFNKSKLATVWGGFSTDPYTRLFKTQAVWDAAGLSIVIAVISATCATILGTMAGMALVRFKRFPGRTAFSGLVTSPLIMPEVITGISLALLFIGIGYATGLMRGATTITIAHITFSMSYVAVIIQSRLASMDRSVEEAAMDLGSKPAQVLFDVTLPIIAPALVSGWLLAFTLSLDDVVITTFTNGPGSTTLPLYIFGQARLGVKPEMNALATIIVTLVGTGVAIAGIMMHRAEKKRERDMQLAYAANK